MALEKRCHYEVLGLSRDCTADEIRSSYKKLALQRHPDKLIQTGLSQAEATAQFQELSHAYEVLSDPKERAWYDSHRSQILFSDPNSANSVPDSLIPNLFSFFSTTVYSGYADTGKGFYKVYSDLFNKIYANEVNFCRKLGLGLGRVREAPLMGNLDSQFGQVTAFYNYWLGFGTVMDFCWVDQYDAMAGPNRKSRRVMEEENKKLRKKAKREYNETVRGLAEFVKKRDKRVIDMVVKKNAEMEKRKEEEKERRKKMERERMERLRAYEEPEWVRVNEQVDEMEGFEEANEKKGSGAKEELYCVVCGKKFKSEKQWKNHEQSKKHKQKVAELRESFGDEEEEDEQDDFGQERQDEEIDYNVTEIEKRFKEDFRIREEENGFGVGVAESIDKVDGSFDADTGREAEEIAHEGGDDDAEMNVLEGLVSGRKSRRKNCGARHFSEDFPLDPRVEDEDKNEEVEVMEYKNLKGKGRRDRKDSGKNNGKEAVRGDIDESKSPNEEANWRDDKEMGEESSSQSLMDNEDDGKADDSLGKHRKSSSQFADKNGAVKRETNAKSKTSSKGKKGKAALKNSGNACETCGEEFESRNKLHKHLGSTGHAFLKFR